MDASEFKPTHKYLLLSENEPTIPGSWFDRQRSRYPHNYELLNTFKAQEIEALQAYQRGKLTTEQAAYTITDPISTSPIPSLNTPDDTLDDDLIPLIHLWQLFIDALIEWPCHWTSRIVALLLAIAKLPHGIHQNEATDDDGNTLLWRDLPSIFFVWSDAHWMQPYDIVARCTNITDRICQRKIYIKQQDVESQLVAAGIFDKKWFFRYIIHVLEMDPNPPHDTPAEFLKVIQPDFHLPAVARWMRYNKAVLSKAIATGELQVWDNGGIRILHKRPEPSISRWLVWKERLSEFAQNGSEELVCSAAREALEHLEAVIATI